MVFCTSVVLDFFLSWTFLSLLGTFVGSEQQTGLISLLGFNLICFLFESCNRYILSENNPVMPCLYCKNNLNVNHGPESCALSAAIIDTTRVIIDAKCGNYT